MTAADAPPGRQLRLRRRALTWIAGVFLGKNEIWDDTFPQSEPKKQL